MRSSARRASALSLRFAGVFADEAEGGDDGVDAGGTGGEGLFRVAEEHAARGVFLMEAEAEAVDQAGFVLRAGGFFERLSEGGAGDQVRQIGVAGDACAAGDFGCGPFGPGFGAGVRR